MIDVKYNKDLAQLNTLGIPSHCEQYIELASLIEVAAVCDHVRRCELPVRVLGEGSNLILRDQVSALVVKMALRGFEVLSESDDDVIVRAYAGENWHQFVLAMIARGYYGLENLALIPGTVGASPVQNIGAYGVEVADFLTAVEGVDLQTAACQRLINADCNFAYRHSRFKERDGCFLITSVEFKLSKQFRPQLDYGPLQSLADRADLKASDVLNEVVRVRQTKLPDPAQLPNAGSFFKNPIVSMTQLEHLLAAWPGLVWYPFAGQAKLAAAWLIDSVGLKGAGNEAKVGCHSEQALVLINPQRAGFQAVDSWAQYVQQQVWARYQVSLEREPCLW